MIESHLVHRTDRVALIAPFHLACESAYIQTCILTNISAEYAYYKQYNVFRLMYTVRTSLGGVLVGKTF